MAQTPPIDQIVRKAFDLHLRYVAAIGQVTADYVKQFIATLETKPDERNGDTAHSQSAGTDAPPASAPAIVFEAAGETPVAAVFMLENHWPEPVEATVVASTVVSPTGETVEVPFTFVPGVIALKPRQQMLVHVVGLIPQFLGENVPYTGYFSVPELKGTTIPFVVRRRPAVG